MATAFDSFLSCGYNNNDITTSTIEREPLSGEYVNTTNYYTDELGWIRSGSVLEKGMKSFFKETGVQPYLYLVDNVNGNPNPSDGEMNAFANALYEDLFTDEGHLLLVFQEHNSNGNYFSYYVAGKQAKTVIDSEAADILLDYIDHYYYSDYDEDEMFSMAFAKAGERIMNKQVSPLIPAIIVVGVIAVLVIGIVWWTKAKKQKNIEAAQNERILNADIGKVSHTDPNLQDLENKYE